ncbi:MAG: UDP-N-acetylmuramoyl-L-alanine--D-glutamate ligase [Armatimonadetes bacterium]|nr:UDP-N-acetylmuramoyl-L-alanine--D-glutamate ligase [Armatimonadota bacterium]
MTLLANPRVAEPLQVEGKHVLVVGAGRSGLAVTKVLCRLGAQVLLSDRRPIEDLADEAEQAASFGAELVGSVEDLVGLPTPDLAVVSPGVPPAAPIMASLRQRGVPVVGELELAWQFCPAQVIAVTGTNGKGTTCRLTHAMLTRAGLQTCLAGNIGRPLTDCLEELTPQHLVVLEVSSFQLATTQTFAPQAAAVLNVRPDHLDWHQDLDDYFAAKQRIFTHQQPEDLAVLVIDDPAAARMAGAVKARLARVSLRQEVEVTWDGRGVRVALPGGEPVVLSVSELAEWGEYHRLDAMVAACLAVEFGAGEQAVREAIVAYEPPEHLMEEVGVVGGVHYINDSKATNPDSAVADLQHLRRRGPVVVISGGKDKGVDLSVWGRALVSEARAVVLIGETARALAQMTTALGPRLASSMDEAVAVAAELAEPGDQVALIPATSSFDMFADYADRGRRFAEAVAGLRK